MAIITRPAKVKGGTNCLSFIFRYLHCIIAVASCFGFTYLISSIATSGPRSTLTTAPTTSYQWLQWKRTEGIGWKAWTIGDAVLSLQYSYSCRWVTYRSHSNEQQTSMQMCVHPENDYISNVIESTGTWPECQVLVNLWNDQRAVTDSNLFMDIGSNLGTCTMEFLLSTNATIVAVEPHPKNLFCLTSTLNRNPDLAKRVIVLPMAVAGHESSGQNVTMALFPPSASRKKKERNKPKLDNFGGAHIKAAISGTSDHHVATVPIEALDTIFQHAKPRLVKLDVEGYECLAMQGMQENVDITLLFTEVFQMMLESASCDTNELLTLLRGSGRKTYMLNAKKGYFVPLPPSNSTGLPGIFNALAVKE